MIIKFALQFFDVVLIIFPRAIMAYGSCFSKFMRNILLTRSILMVDTPRGSALCTTGALVSGSTLGKGGPGEGECPGD